MKIHLTSKQWSRAKVRLPKSVIIAKSKSKKVRVGKRKVT